MTRVIGLGLLLVGVLAMTPPPAAVADYDDLAGGGRLPYQRPMYSPYYSPYYYYPPSYYPFEPPPNPFHYPSAYNRGSQTEYTRPAAPYKASASDMPTVSGPLPAPPPGTAMLRVEVPQTWATVRINGRDTDSMGKRRYFVTPRLKEGQAYRYTVSATWKLSDGSPVSQEQVITVASGETPKVDLTRAAPSSEREMRATDGYR